MKLTQQQLKTLRQMRDGIVTLNKFGGRSSLQSITVRQLRAMGFAEYAGQYSARPTEAGLAALAAAENEPVASGLMGF